MVVGERQIHHRPRLHRAIGHDHRAHLRLVHAEDAGLGRIQDRRREERAVDAAVRNGEGAAGKVVEAELAVPGLAGELADRLLDAGEAHVLRIAQDRHDEPLLRADRDADVVVVLKDDLVAVDLGVDRRHVAQALDRRLHEERHEAEAHAVALLEVVAEFLPDGQDFRHVDLVEGRQHGGGVLGFLQPLRDAAAETRHAHPLFRPIGFRLGDGEDVAAAGFEIGQHIALGQPAAAARRRDLARDQAVFRDQLLDRRRHRRRAGLGGGRRDHQRRPRRRRAARRRLGLDRLRPRLRRFLAHIRRRRFFRRLFFRCVLDRLVGGRAFRDRAQQRAHLDIVALGDRLALEHAGRRRRHLDRHLVGLELDQRLVGGDRLAGLLQPAGDRGLGDGFAQGRDDDFN